MRGVSATTRMVLAAALAVGQAWFSLSVVYELTLGQHLRMMAFVLVFPWVVALVALPRARLLDALGAVFGRAIPSERPTIRALEFVGGLTFTAAAIAVLSVAIPFHDAVYDKDPAGPGRTLPFQLDFVVALVRAPVFALIVRLLLYDPPARRLRARFEPAETSRSWRPVLRKAGIVVGVILVGALAVKIAWLKPAKLRPKPTWDISMTAIGVDCDGNPCPDIGPRPPGEPDPIRIVLARAGKYDVECRIAGERLTDLPADYAKLEGIVRRRIEAGGGGSRSIDVAAEGPVAIGRLVSLLDQCLRLRRPAHRGGAGLLIPEVRVVVQLSTGFTVTPRLRFVYEAYRPGRPWRVALELPAAEEAEEVRRFVDHAPPIHVTWDLEQRIAEFYVDHDLVGLWELEAFLHRHLRLPRNEATRTADLTVVIRSDKLAPVSRIYSILEVLAGKNLRVRHVHLAVKIVDRPRSK